MNREESGSLDQETLGRKTNGSIIRYCIMVYKLLRFNTQIGKSAFLTRSKVSW